MLSTYRLFEDNSLFLFFLAASNSSLFDVKMESCRRQPSMLHLFLIFAYLPSSVLAKLLFPDGKHILIWHGCNLAFLKGKSVKFDPLETVYQK